MVRYAVGYRSRAFVTFGAPIAAGDCDPESRSDVLELTRLVRARIGAQVKVLPTAVFHRGDAARRSRAAISRSASTGCWKSSPRVMPIWRDERPQAIDEGCRAARNPRHHRPRARRFRVRERNVLRYYARSIDHLLATRTRALTPR
jgi:hypothetical protein